jgi:Family of unknown function (DUF6600)/FecR protein
VDIARPALLLATFALASAVPAFSQEPAAPTAHVAFVEGSATLERDGAVEMLDSAVPVVDGDRLRTPGGRLEIFFQDGSTLQMDQSSTLDVQSADLLRLIAGAITFNAAPGRRVYAVPLYRVDTPAGSVLVDAPGEYRISTGSNREIGTTVSGDRAPITTLEVARGIADLMSDSGSTTVRTGERSSVRIGELPAFPVRFNSARVDRFGQWGEMRRNDRQTASASTAYLPPNIQTYGATLDRYGTWTTDVQYGTVWYPTVVSGWRPYATGRWSWVPRFGWTWVGSEAWAWPTQHYGRWGLNGSGGWFWIPGASWALAAPIIIVQPRQVFGGGRRFDRGDHFDRWDRFDRRGRANQVGSGNQFSDPRSDPIHGPLRSAVPLRPTSPGRPLSQPAIGLPHPAIGLPSSQSASPTVFETPYQRSTPGGPGAPRMWRQPLGSSVGGPAMPVSHPPMSSPQRGAGWRMPSTRAQMHQPSIPSSSMPLGPRPGRWVPATPQAGRR